MIPSSCSFFRVSLSSKIIDELRGRAETMDSLISDLQRTKLDLQREVQDMKGESTSSRYELLVVFDEMCSLSFFVCCQIPRARMPN